MAAGNGMKNMGKGASAEEITPIFCLEGRTCVWDIWNVIRTEREREAQRMSIFIYKATVTK